MKLLYQNTYSEYNRLAQHLGCKDWNSVPEEKREGITQFKGLLKAIEREFHTRLFQQQKADFIIHQDNFARFEALDQIENIKY